MATYRIGPSDFFTGGDLAADASTLNGQINALDNLDWLAPSNDVFDGWIAFVSEWRGFYSSTFSGFLGNFVAWNNGNRDQLIQFEDRFATWAQTYQQASGKQLPGGVINVSTGTKDTLGDQLAHQLQPLVPSVSAKTILIGAAIGGLILIIVFREPLSKLAGKLV